MDSELLKSFKLQSHKLQQQADDQRILQFLEAHNITIEQAPELCIIDRFYDGSWNIRLQTDGERMLLKLKQAQRAATDAIRLIPAVTYFHSDKLDYAAIVVLCELHGIITPGMIESNKLADQLPPSERIALQVMIVNAFIEWCGNYHAPKALRQWSEQQ